MESVGSKGYNLLRDLKAPAKPSEFKLVELLEALSNHFQPKPTIIAGRLHFHKRDQEEGEGMVDYAAALKRCSERCEFGGFLEQALRDRFVCGLRNRQIQKRLLTKTELTWKKALDTAIAMESAETISDQWHRPQTSMCYQHVRRTSKVESQESRNRVSVAVEATHHKRAGLRIKRVISVNARGISKRFAEKREPPNQREEMSLRTPTQYVTWKTSKA